MGKGICEKFFLFFRFAGFGGKEYENAIAALSMSDSVYHDISLSGGLTYV